MCSLFSLVLVVPAVAAAGDRWNKLSPHDPIKGLVVDARQRISAGVIIRSSGAWKQPHDPPVVMAAEEQK